MPKSNSDKSKSLRKSISENTDYRKKRIINSNGRITSSKPLEGSGSDTGRNKQIRKRKINFQI